MKPDEIEFTEVIKANQAIINKVCFGYANTIEDRNDLRQEIVIQIWKALPQFNHQSKTSTWIYRIALNTAISIFRKSKRKITGDAQLSDCRHIPADQGDPDLEENIARLFELICKLDELERAIMMLYLDDNSYADIAAIVGISETNVATKINRIKTKLKNQFTHTEDMPSWNSMK